MYLSTFCITGNQRWAPKDIIFQGIPWCRLMNDYCLKEPTFGQIAVKFRALVGSNVFDSYVTLTLDTFAIFSLLLTHLSRGENVNCNMCLIKVLPLTDPLRVPLLHMEHPQYPGSSSGISSWIRLISLETHWLLNVNSDRGPPRKYGGGMRAGVLGRRIEGIEGVWSWLTSWLSYLIGFLQTMGEP